MLWLQLSFKVQHNKIALTLDQPLRKVKVGLSGSFICLNYTVLCKDHKTSQGSININSDELYFPNASWLSDKTKLPTTNTLGNFRETPIWHHHCRTAGLEVITLETTSEGNSYLEHFSKSSISQFTNCFPYFLWIFISSHVFILLLPLLWPQFKYFTKIKKWHNDSDIRAFSAKCLSSQSL